MARKSNNFVKVGLIQMACGLNPNENLARALKQTQKAAQKGAQIICLQEIFRSRYFPVKEEAKNFELAESIPGPTSEALSELAQELKVVIVASLFEKRARGIYHNTAVVIDADGSIAGKYRKMHIPDDPFYYEKFYFTPGDLGFQSFKTRYAEIGVLICWDQWFPEAARLTALQGAQILFYPTAIGWLTHAKKEITQSYLQAWELIQRGHGIANGVYVAAANRVGIEGKLRFWGGSFVSGPFGEWVAQGSKDKEEIVIAPCDLSKVDETRQEWPFLRDRRIDAYKSLTQRFLD
jgi:N-carbamoylputrescine amidase